MWWMITYFLWLFHNIYVCHRLFRWLTGEEFARRFRRQGRCGFAEDVGFIPGSGRSLGGGNGSPLQYSCLENPMDRGAWRATVHGVTQKWTWLSNWEQHKAKISCKTSLFSLPIQVNSRNLSWDILCIMFFVNKDINDMSPPWRWPWSLTFSDYWKKKINHDR